MRILVTGATGQIGSELVPALREVYGRDNVVASSRRRRGSLTDPFVELDVLRRDELERVVRDYKIEAIVHLAAVLSAKGEQDPALAWDVNTNGTINVLEVARANKLEMVVVPSSIAVYGPETPDNPGDITIMKPKTIYGISKVVTELLGEYYYSRYGLDVRGPRLPGVISWKTPPGGGTTDYAVEAFYEAVKRREYTFWVRPDTRLPMIYMPDTIRAFLLLMKAESSSLTARFYNVQGMSFTARELAETIRKFIPEFKADFKPDPLRQRIADSWPKSIDDSRARRDWGWKPEWDLESMSRDMIENLRRVLVESG
jgi:nucleoside-diphosphate-sugar epimerase